MREILYRGKRVDNGEWVYGAYYKQEYVYGDKKEAHCIITTSDVLSNDLWLDYEEVIPETVGQFTGLTDKNGEKIFEGDIVKAIQTEYDEDKEKEPFIFEVVGEMIFDDACFGLKAKKVFDFYSPMWKEDDVELEVIGNIHDNPELLKGEEE